MYYLNYGMEGEPDMNDWFCLWKTVLLAPEPKLSLFVNLNEVSAEKCSWGHNTRMRTSYILTITSMFILSPLISLCPLLPSPQSLLLWFPCKTLGTWPGHLFILWENRIRDALEGKPHQSGQNLPLPASYRGPLISMMSRRKTWLKHRQLRSTWTAQTSWDGF